MEEGVSDFLGSLSRRFLGGDEVDFLGRVLFFGRPRFFCGDGGVATAVATAITGGDDDAIMFLKIFVDECFLRKKLQDANPAFHLRKFSTFWRHSRHQTFFTWVSKKAKITQTSQQQKLIFFKK